MTNPYTSDLHNVQKQLQAQRQEHHSWTTQWQTFSNYDLRAAKALLENTRTALACAQTERDLAGQHLLAVLARLKEQDTVGLRLTALFSSSAQDRRDNYQLQRVHAQAKAQNLRATWERLQQEEHKQSQQLRAAEQFNVLTAQAALQALDRSIPLLESKIKHLQHKEQRWDRYLRPLDTDIQAKEDEIKALEATVRQALALESDLRNASDGYARKQVHAQSERQLGHGKPEQVRRDAESQQLRIQRQLNKLYARYDEIQARMDMEIEQVLIDGSNLCYKHNRGGNGAFIGLKALQALMPALHGYRVTLFFDFGILQQLHISREALASQWPDAKVHVSNRSIAADNVILAMAAHNAKAVVVSNDRYSDFPEVEHLRQRLIRHEITDTLLVIKDLDISVPL